MTWISINDRLPELNTPVLGYVDDPPYSRIGIMVLCDTLGGMLWIPDNLGEWCADYGYPVTHWQPIPEPPQ